MQMTQMGVVSNLASVGFASDLASGLVSSSSAFIRVYRRFL